MSHILQLNPSIPLNTSKGSGEAILVLDYGPEFDILLTVILDSNGEIWTFKSSECRGLKNITLGRSFYEQK